MNERAAKALGRSVRNRMRELELSQAELVRRSGLSEPTVNAISRGQAAGYRDATLLRLAVALGWTRESIDRLRDGRAPVVANSGGAVARSLPAAEDVASPWAAITRLEERVEALAAEVAELKGRRGRAPLRTTR